MREKVLVFGSIFSIAPRIADLLKREFEVIEYEFEDACQSGRPEVSTVFTGELLSDALVLHRARWVVFTSESLLYISSSSVFDGLLNELMACKRLAGVSLAYVNIAEPIVVGERQCIQTLTGDSDYARRVSILSESLVGVADTVIDVVSVYTSEDDRWGQNFLRLLFDLSCDQSVEIRESGRLWEVFSADEVAGALIPRLSRPGAVRLTCGPYPGGLRAFCAAATLEFKGWLSGQNVTLPEHYGKQNESNTPLGHESRGSGLPAVIRQSRCAVNYLYRKDPSATFGVETIADFRNKLGNALSRSIPREVVAGANMVLPVPETGRIYAQGLAKTLGLPYVEAIYKSDLMRSFDIESSDVRREFLYSRLTVVPGLVTGKSVIVVDEAIFTGATLKVVSRLLRDGGARSVYFAIPSPESRYSCKFNMQPKRALLADYVRNEDLPSYFDVQGVFFQEMDVFMKSIEQDGPQCVACFVQKGRL